MPVGGEFDLIRRFFDQPDQDAETGIGDDAAVLRPRSGQRLLAAADMLVAGRHFPESAGPGSIGHKALAVNLSDLAAMAGRPRWALLSLALPEANARWLSGFSGGFLGLARQHGVSLVGGDTTRGPLTVAVTLLGEAAPGAILTRHGARPGDTLWVSGSLGGAALALAGLQGRMALEGMEAARCRPLLHLPTPRVALGQALAGLASAAIDISDGLLADLAHLLEGGGLAARLDFAALPAHPDLARRLEDPLAMDCLLAGGDDYELLFAAPPHRREAIESLATADCPLSPIGVLEAGDGVIRLMRNGRELVPARRGWDHFVD